MSRDTEDGDTLRLVFLRSFKKSMGTNGVTEKNRELWSADLPRSAQEDQVAVSRKTREPGQRLWAELCPPKRHRVRS